MIKAVIFDFFGVLAVRGSVGFRQTYFADDELKMAQAKKLQDELGLGKIGYDDFVDGLAKLGGVDRDTVLKYTEDYQPNQELLDYIRAELKPAYKLGIISNAGADWVLRILGRSNTKLFNDIILSYQVEVIKPEAEIYRMSARNLGVQASECVFVDDITTYCDGARTVGMKAIWYKDFEQMKSELEKLLRSISNN